MFVTTICAMYIYYG